MASAELLGARWKQQIRFVFRSLQESSSKLDRPLPSPDRKNSPDLRQSKEQRLEKKVGPSPPRGDDPDRRTGQSRSANFSVSGHHLDSWSCISFPLC